MDNTLRMRVKKFLEFSKISHADFARLAGVTPAYVANIKNNVTVPVLEILKNINPGLSLDWLLLGRGDMLAITAADVLAKDQEHAAKLDKIAQDHAAEVEKLNKINAELSEKVALLQRIIDLNDQIRNG